MEDKLLSIAHAPDQKLQVELLLHPHNKGLALRVLYDGTLILSSSDIGIDFHLDEKSSVEIDRTNDLPYHEIRPLPFGGTELVVRLSRGWEEEVLIRLFVTDDRVAFRYEFGEGTKGCSYDERTSFLPALDATCLSVVQDIGIQGGNALDLPVLFELDNGLYMSLDHVPNAPVKHTLQMAEGRLLRTVTDQSPITVTSDATPWWVVSFTHP